MEKVSVLMSVFNEEEIWLKKSIDSILNQSYKNIEFIIVLDNPKNILLKNLLDDYKRKDERIRLIINKSNIGLVESLNKAIKFSTGKYIARMDADDISNKHRIEKQVKFLSDNNIDFVASIMERIDENDNLLQYDLPVNTNINIRQAIAYYFPHPTWMFKRNVIEKLLKYNNVECAEDYDFTCRAILAGFKLFVINEYLLQYRIRNNGISKKNELRQKMNSKIIRNNYRKSLILKLKYNPYKELKHIKINKNIEKRYEEASKMFFKKYNKSKFEKIIIYIKIFFVSREYFKYNILISRVNNKLLRKVFFEKNDN